MDNGTEFQSKALDDWAYRNGVQLEFIRPGKPTDNAYIESFNGKFRDECLNESWFTSLEEAKRTIEGWRVDYNENRPHSALGGIPPREFGERQRSVLNSNGA
jgi:putative transposase